MFGGGAKPIGGGALAPPGPYGSYGPDCIHWVDSVCSFLVDTLVDI